MCSACTDEETHAHCFDDSANIIGVDASIELCFGDLSVKSNLSVEFTIINHCLVQDLKRLGLWDDVMVMDLKHFDGSLAPIDQVPKNIKALYATYAEKTTDSSACVSALERATAAARLQLATGATTDIRFRGVDDPTCESCQRVRCAICTHRNAMLLHNT